MPDNRTASIVIATYNGAHYINEQLDSIRNQTVKPLELIVGDDGSTDETLEIVTLFGQTAGFPVEIVRNVERLGYRRNFMNIASKCRGDIVFFCDQDDVWSLNKLERVLPAFDDPKAMLVYHNAVVVDSALTPQFNLYDVLSESWLLRRNPFHFSLGFTQAYRRTLNDSLRFWPSSYDNVIEGEVLAHDQWFMFVASLIGKVVFVDETLAAYRQHGANVFGVQQARKADDKSGVRHALFGVADWNGGKAVAAADRARLAREILTLLPKTAWAQATDRANRYTTLATWLATWHAATASPTLASRVSALLRNLLDGAYTNQEPWRLRTGWLLGDVIRTVRKRRESPTIWWQRGHLSA